MGKVTAINLPQTISVALLVIAGYYGNNPERAEKLQRDGYDAAKVQRCVNDLLPILKRYTD